MVADTKLYDALGEPALLPLLSPLLELLIIISLTLVPLPRAQACSPAHPTLRSRKVGSHSCSTSIRHD